MENYGVGSIRVEKFKNGIAYCCDSDDLIESLTFDVMITDPPYGINLGEHSGAKETRSGLLVKKSGYEDTVDYFDKIVVPIITKGIELSKRSMVFSVPPNMWKFPAPDVIGGVFIGCAVGRNKWGWSNMIHCLLYGTAPNLNLGAKTTAIANSNLPEKFSHPTVKPLQWLKWAVDLGSKENEIILDPFAGSGTTAIACINFNRRFIMIEKEPKYFDLMCKRIRYEETQLKLF